MGGTVTHNKWYVALVLYNVLTLCAAFVLCAFSVTDASGGLFLTNQRRRSDLYQVDMGPSNWVFFMWFVVFPVQCLWQLYALINLFRKTDSKQPLYSSPYLLRPLILGFYVVANGATVAWCFLFDRGYVEVALAAVSLSSILLAAALVFSYRSLGGSLENLVLQGREGDVWCVRVFVHNGLAVYLSWCCFLTALNLAFALNQNGVGAELSSMIALGVLASVLGVYLFADIAAVVRHSRYTFSFYVMMAVALVPVFLNVGSGSRSSIYIFSVILCGTSGVLCLVKLAIAIVLCVSDTRDED